MNKGPHSPLDCYLDLPALAAYSCMSERSLRDYLNDPEKPLPCYRPGGRGKVLVKRSEFDRWLAQWRSEGGALKAKVAEIMADLATQAQPGGSRA